MEYKSVFPKEWNQKMNQFGISKQVGSYYLSVLSIVVVGGAGTTTGVVVVTLTLYSCFRVCVCVYVLCFEVYWFYSSLLRCSITLQPTKANVTRMPPKKQSKVKVSKKVSKRKW